MIALAPHERRARALAEFAAGAPVALAPGAVAVAAEALRPDRLAALRRLGPVDLAVTARRAETLKARAYDGDLARIALPEDADAARILALADPALALARPLIGPCRSRRDGPADAHRLAIRLARAARLLPAALVTPVADPAALAAREGLSLIDDTLLDAHARLEERAAAPVPLALAGLGRVRLFRPGEDGAEHYAVEIGEPARDRPVLARLHSACFTGDVLGSLKCDCGPQLNAALSQIGAEGAGVLLYLNQEGRGIGLANKLRAYALQEQGFDTVEANHRLGFEDDERDFRLGASMLRTLGFTAVRLMTNNPRKVAAMEAAGVSVTERVPLKVGENPLNTRYLAVKAAKSGHLL